MGRHAADLPPEDIPKAIMWVWIARMSTIVSFCFCKLSIAWMLLRISSIKRKYRYILYSSMIVNVGVSIIWLIMTIKCVPAHANWLGEEPGDKCIPGHVTTNHAYFAGGEYLQSLPSFLTDVLTDMCIQRPIRPSIFCTPSSLSLLFGTSSSARAPASVSPAC
jgi:hypothetical protein